VSLRVLLIDESATRAQDLLSTLRGAGYAQVFVHDPNRELNREIVELNPEVILIDMDSPDRDTLENLRFLSRECRQPIVMFAERADDSALRQAIEAGVSAYVVDGVRDAARIKPVLEVAVARFREHQLLKEELVAARGKLAERKLVDRAKGALMSRKRVSETEAYETLRRLAMNRGVTVGRAAQLMLDAMELVG
jgi:two-component system, response regulator / RNA-binding antiterminator